MGFLFDKGFSIAEKYVKEANREVKLNFEGGYWEKFVK